MFLEIIENQKVYDVVIVGSGSGGVMNSKVLANALLKVTVFEAGSFFDPSNPRQQTQLKWPYLSLRRLVSKRNTF